MSTRSTRRSKGSASGIQLGTYRDDLVAVPTSATGLRRSSDSKSCLKKATSYCGEAGLSVNGAANAPAVGMRKNVSFHRIEITEFPMELGDNPSAANGIPIQIGWKPHRRHVFELDYYERRTTRRAKRAPAEMIIPPNRRLGMVTSQGATMKEIAHVTREKRMIQQSRMQSVNNMHLDKYHERVESVQRKLGKLKKAATWSSLSTSSSANNANFASLTQNGSPANATFDLSGKSLSKQQNNAAKLRQIAGIPLSKPAVSLSSKTRLGLLNTLTPSGGSKNNMRNRSSMPRRPPASSPALSAAVNTSGASSKNASFQFTDAIPENTGMVSGNPLLARVLVDTTAPIMTAPRQQPMGSLPTTSESAKSLSSSTPSESNSLSDEADNAGEHKTLSEPTLATAVEETIPEEPTKETTAAEEPANTETTAEAETPAPTKEFVEKEEAEGTNEPCSEGATPTESSTDEASISQKEEVSAQSEVNATAPAANNDVEKLETISQIPKTSSGCVNKSSIRKSASWTQPLSSFVPSNPGSNEPSSMRNASFDGSINGANRKAKSKLLLRASMNRETLPKGKFKKNASFHSIPSNSSCLASSRRNSANAFASPNVVHLPMKIERS